MDSSLQGNFLRDLQRAKKGRIFLALFGKHPAWDDHMEDLGLATPSLRTCKRVLYIEGMAANAARHRTLDEDEGAALSPYRHVLLWIRNEEAILLRLVESTDGRGRHYFPLVGAVHFSAPSTEDALRWLLPPLQSFVHVCRHFTDRTAVQNHLRQSQARLDSERERLPAGNDQSAQPIPEECDALRTVSQRTNEVVSVSIPVTRYDLASSLAALVTAWRTTRRNRDQPLLLAHGDDTPVIICCAGRPNKDDFWFLRRHDPP